MADRSVVVRLRAEVEGFRRGMSDAAAAADKAQKRFDAVGDAGRSLATVGLAMAAGVGVAVKAYADFDKQMSKVQAATHATTGDMQQLREAAINAGADTAFSAKEAGQAIEELSKAGVSTKDILGGGLNGALSLAAAGELEVGKAAEIAATALTQFKLGGKDIPHVADLLAAGAGKAQGSVEDLGMALNQSGLVAAQYGLSIEDTTAGLASFASAGLVGSDAGTSFKTMLQRLTPTSNEAAEKMAELGFSAFDANGNIKSLDAIAGNLQKSMKNLTPEARNSAMAIIFGSDAVRAANVLFEQGAKGIDDWKDKVNDAGYAAQTAAINQDNLAGDIEKLGGSIDAAFLKSGGAMNDVLRDMAKSLEGAIDWIGGLPTPMLQSTLAIGGTVAAVALFGGGLLVAIPKVAAAKASWDAFSTSNEKLSGKMKTSAKVATVAAAAFAGLQIAGAITKAMGPAPKTMEEFAQATLKGADRMERLNAVFKDNQGTGDINNLGQAVLRLNDNMIGDQFAEWSDGMFGMTSTASRLRNNMNQLDQQLQVLSSGGAGKEAAQLFNDMAAATNKEADAQKKAHVSTEQLLKLTPQYADSLRKQATALGVTLTNQELYDLAVGKTNPKLAAAMLTTEGKAKMDQFAAEAAKANAEALADLGLNADGTIQSLSKLVELMFKSGLVTQSARDAEAAYQETLDGLKTKIDEVKASQSAGNATFNSTRTSFDLTSDAGRKANAVFGDLAEKATSTTQAMANNNATQGQLQTKLHDSYTQLVNTAKAFGIGDKAADDMARSVLGIPKDAKVDTAIKNYADTLAKLNGVKDAANALNGKQVSIGVNTVFTETGAKPQGYRVPIGTVAFKEHGGTIPEYHASGHMIGSVDWRNNGTDKTPVMATPGEFMMNRGASRSIGYENLEYMNANGRLPRGGGDAAPVMQDIKFYGSPAYSQEQFESFAEQRMNSANRRMS